MFRFPERLEYTASPPHDSAMAMRKLPKIDIQQVYDDLDALWWDTVNDGPVIGMEAYDRLFGKEAVLARLEGAEALRADFMRRFIGPVHGIADFAVTSGHEAVAFFGGRVSNYVRVRQRPLREIPLQIAEAEAANLRREATKAKAALHVAMEQFAQAVRSALNGWAEHRAWISRSLFQELLLADPTASASQMLSAKKAGALRALHERRLPIKILEALRDAGGSMTREDLRDAIAPEGSARSKQKRRALNNYFAPKGSLVVEGLISLHGKVVTLEAAGMEAIK